MPGIEALTLQFVDALSDTANVLLDLNTRAPIFVMADGWSAPPPQKNVSVFTSTSRDGSNIAQESYNDRELMIRVGILSTSPDHAAEAIQSIGRLIGSAQWLRYQPDTIEPVWFRTRPGEIEVIDELNGQADGFRIVTIRLPAEYASYGAAVTNTVTINNDPTAATNPMSYAFPDIQGDVATPLVLRDHVNYLDTCMLSMSASPSVPTVPIIRQTYSVAAVAGWASTSGVADTAAIGGTTNQVAKSSGTLSYSFTVSFTGVPLGDWRLVMRARSGIDYRVFAQRKDLADAGRPAQASTLVPTNSSYRYVDLGVHRLPANGSVSNPPGLAAASTSSVDVVVTLSSSSTSGIIYPDDFQLVPAGLDDAVFSSLLLGGGASPLFAVYPTQIDSLSGSMWVGDGTAYYSPATFAGGFPQVVPGVRNVLTLVKSTKGFIDDKTVPSVLDYLYYPRYLYTRPATT